jgi:hypothetical protein
MEAQKALGFSNFGGEGKQRVSFSGNYLDEQIIQEKPQRHGGTEKALSEIRTGLIINFYTGALRHGIKRLVLELCVSVVIFAAGMPEEPSLSGRTLFIRCRIRIIHALTLCSHHQNQISVERIPGR